VEKEKKGRKRFYTLLGALALALMLTGGLFAYTYTTANIALGMTAQSDIASVTPRSGLNWGNVFGHSKGDLPNNEWLFSITPENDYTGDLTVKVSIMNPGALALAYQYFNMQLALTDAGGNIIIGSGLAPAGHKYQVLSLENGVVGFDVAYSAGAGSPFYVKLVDGGYATFSRSPLDWASGYSVNPQLFCEVVARK